LPSTKCADYKQWFFIRLSCSRVAVRIRKFGFILC